MFRRERPQKGRYRQFHQVDVEVFGVTSPSVDVEVIEMALAYLEGCGLTQYELVLNSVGDAKCRPAYVETLRAALRAQAREPVRRLPAAHGDQPAARPRLQGARRTSPSSNRCRRSRTTSATSAARTSRRCGASWSCWGSRTA